MPSSCSHASLIHYLSPCWPKTLTGQEWLRTVLTRLYRGAEPIALVCVQSRTRCTRQTLPRPSMRRARHAVFLMPDPLDADWTGHLQ